LANGWQLPAPIADFHRQVTRHAWRTQKKNQILMNRVLFGARPAVVNKNWTQDSEIMYLLSSTFHLTMDTLGVRLYPSRYRVGSGLSPFRTCAHRAHNRKSHPALSRVVLFSNPVGLRNTGLLQGFGHRKRTGHCINDWF
jgi:hypothetical protein